MPDEYTTPAQIVSYDIGRQMGDRLLSDPFDGMDPKSIFAGLMDALDQINSPISNEAFTKAFEDMNTIMQEKHAELAKISGAESKAFLAKNAKKDGITITESGLQYKILKAGTGDLPTANSVVSTHYHGTLIDGTVFDSSVERGEPTEFPVNQVIAGWTEALQIMPKGSKWRLYIPPNLAYGANGSGDKIIPYSALIFDIELLDIIS